MNEPVIEARELAKSYGDTVAVKRLTFTALPGEIVGLLGPNGAGKTTAIRVLTTILRPTSGDFIIAGIPADRALEIRRRIGVLPESPGYPGSMTGEHYIRYHARLYGLPARTARSVAASLLAEVGLADRASWSINTYSRGMRQRLGLARALVNEPQVIFLDEPTLGLDPAGQRQVLGLIVDIARLRGATIILSTHFLDEVEEVCSRALILNRGEVVAEGTIETIKRSVLPERSARIEVPPDEHNRAVAALSSQAGVAVESDGLARPGRITVSFRQGTPPNAATKALVDAGVPILLFSVLGSRLSDAFLKITGES